MKNNLINSFLKLATNNSNTAIIYKKFFKVQKKTYDEFLSDIYKAKSLIEQKVSSSNVLIFSYPYQYDFYVSILATIFSGKNIVIIDSFKDKLKTIDMLKQAECEYVLVDRLTYLFKNKLPNNLKFVDISKYYSYNESLECKDSANVITFTSGTTGHPKMIKRNLEFLERQIDLIKTNIKLDLKEVVYGLLPMYTLLALFLGYPCVVSKKIMTNEEYLPTTIICPIRRILKENNTYPSVKKAYFGGAILYPHEANKIKQILPNATIYYTYGASEGALIYQTTLYDYLNNPFTFNKKIEGIDVKIVNPNNSGIGEIAISGKSVIGNNNTHLTGDIGKLIDGKLILLGRKKYSSLERDFYNYEFDELERRINSDVKDLFSFFYDDKIYVVYSKGEFNHKYPNITYVRIKNMPFDLKHNTKLDYQKAIEIIYEIGR